MKAICSNMQVNLQAFYPTFLGFKCFRWMHTFVVNALIAILCVTNIGKWCMGVTYMKDTFCCNGICEPACKDTNKSTCLEFLSVVLHMWYLTCLCKIQSNWFKFEHWNEHTLLLWITSFNCIAAANCCENLPTFLFANPERNWVEPSQFMFLWKYLFKIDVYAFDNRI